MDKFNAWQEISLKDFVDGDENDEEVQRKALKAYEEAATDGLVDLALSCLTKTRPDLLELDEDGDRKGESVLDMLSVYKIIEICGGIKLNDPKMMEAVAKATETL